MFNKNACGAEIIVQTGQIKTTAVAIKNGRMFLNFCFIDSAGQASKAMKNTICTSTVVIRIKVARVSSAPMAAIRRYFDLVVQRQISNFLKGESPVYSKKELEEISVFVSPVIKDLQNIKRNRIRYWILKYLSQQRGEKYKAMVLDEFRRKYRIVLIDFFLVTEIGRQEGIILNPGEEVLVEVRKADPWEDVIKLEYAACRE